MLIDATALKHIFIVCGKTDLRKGIDGLAAFVIEEYDLDVYDQALFLFCGTKKDRFKALYWDQNGFVLMYKRFESGYLQWPRSRKEVLQLNPLLLERLLTSLSIEEKCTLKETKKGAIY
ncbi:IS66 family insertion sequence element accessory protein TnpB [Enterococcus casseliflavus]|uniref:IS66 family insertion sequence element accessory protein TnpB n=1 Tax=Enterococcus casseliflavus TaxID=37734 RepID=UPI0034D21840